MSHRSSLFYALLVTTASASLVSSSAWAWDNENVLSNFYLGLDAQVRHMPFKRNFGHNLFRNHFAQGNFYGGLKFNCYSGLELGFTESRTIRRQTSLTAGEVSAGIEIPPDLAPVNYYNTARVTGAHLSLVGYYSACETDPLKLIGSIGVMYGRATFIRTATSMAGISVNGVRLHTRRQAMPRAMIGLQYQFMDNFSARGTLAWEKTSVLNSTASNLNSVFLTQVQPKDSVISGIGVVWHF